jgi:hypothetical protein
MRAVAALVTLVTISICGFASTARAQVPTIDIQRTCRYAAQVMVQLMGGSTASNDLDICVRSEEAARQQLAKDWGTYRAADKTLCVQAQVYLPSYMEWLTCLEMERDVTKTRGMAVGPDPNAPMTLPVVLPGVNDGYPAQGYSSTGPAALPTVPLGVNDGFPEQGYPSTAPYTLPRIDQY